MSTITVTLADQINREITLAEASLRTAVEHAWNAGRLLLEQKEQLAHGAWLPWLEENVNLSARRAQEWMDLADSYARAPAHSSIEQALKDARKQRQPPASEVTNLLRGIAAGDPDAPDGTTVIRERLDDARDRLQAEAAVEWSQQQQRKRARAGELLDDSRSKLAAAAAGRLSAFGVAEALRDAAITARHAAAALDDLAFTFER